jgi:hypothetical protein
MDLRQWLSPNVIPRWGQKGRPGLLLPSAFDDGYSPVVRPASQPAQSWHHLLASTLDQDRQHTPSYRLRPVATIRNLLRQL